VSVFSRNYCPLSARTAVRFGQEYADRYYNDFSLLNVWDSNSVYFVVRHKENLKFVTIKENELTDNGHQHVLKRRNH
jgi:hypothetical protein